MVDCVPYLAPAKWYARWLQARIDDCMEPIAEANAVIIPGRDFARCTITDKAGHKMMLSAAVEGGARQLRSPHNMRGIRLSDHGDWRRAHPLAIDACYGRAPFFQHISDLIFPVYQNKETGSLCEFCNEMHRVVVSLLMGNISEERLKLLNENDVIRKRGREIAAEIDTDVSILDPLMKFGPDAITGIIALYN